jgi:hypothetical protein
MRLKPALALALGALALLSYAGPASTAALPGRLAVSADHTTFTQIRDSRRKRPLEVTIYGRRRIGGYSYRAPDVNSTYGRSPPPYLDVRQSPGGPFDSGFFFDSGISPRGGNSPYFH